MKVFINALSARLGGGQTYLVNLLQYIPKKMDLEIFIIAPETLDISYNEDRITRIGIHERYIRNPFLRALWEKFILRRILTKAKADILFCPGGVINTKVPKGCKTITMFRNMLPFDVVQMGKYPFRYEKIRLLLLKRVFLRSMEYADLVIFISNFAKGVIEGYIGCKLMTTKVIPHGLNQHFKISKGTKLPKPAFLPQGEYILYVSRFERYKRHLEVIQGFSLLKKKRNTPEKLVLVGGYDNGEIGQAVRQEIKRLCLENDVILLGNINYNKLPAIYQNAKINIFASECENCPNIMLEALGSGRPLVSSNRQPMPEFGGDAAVYFDPAIPEDLADKLCTIIDDKKAMEHLSELALTCAQKYDWAQTATRTWEEIESIYRLNKS